MSAELAARPCAACGITGQPLAVTRSKGIGETDWRELWRCEDITACHDRLFPELALLLAEHAAGSSVDLTPAQLVTLGQVLGDAIAHREPCGFCADCDASPTGLCEDHAEDLDRCDAYGLLAKALGVEL